MFEAETVVKYIIEKLVSYTITESQRSEISLKIPDYTFDYVKTLVTDALRMEYLTCDLDLTDKNKEEDYESLDIKPRTLYLVNRISGINDYSFMAAPV